MAFHDVKFPGTPEWGVSGGPRFRTTTIVTASGFEQRNVEWDDPLRRWQITLSSLSVEEFESLADFFLARQGSAHSFPFRDPADFAVEAMVFGEGDGVETEFPLARVYADTVTPRTRRITRPRPATVSVFVGGVLTAATVDRDGGMVTFSSAPADGAVLSWSGEFDIPARFESDEANWTLEGPFTSWSGLSLVEVRE